MKSVLKYFVISLVVCLTACSDNKQYLGDVTVYEVDIQALSDKDFYEDGADAIFDDINDKTSTGRTPYKVSEFSCPVYRDNDHYAIKYNGNEYVLEKLGEPEYAVCQGSRIIFHYHMGSQWRVKDLPY